MQVSVEATSTLSRKLTISVPEETIRQQVESRLQSLSHKVKVDGFRPGKVPRGVVKKRYGQQVREEVLSDVIRTSFQDALRDEKLNPAGSPEITATRAEEGQGLEYEVNLEVMPEFVPMPLETLEVRRFVSHVEESDVDRMIERLRDQKKTWQEAQRPSVTGDRVTIAFEGFHEGESFTRGRVESFQLILGSGMMIPGFEDRLTGQERGARLEFELTFPENYPGETMAGKTGRFEVEVVNIEEAVLPEVDANFAQAFGVEDGSIEGLRADIRANMEREMRRILKQRTKVAVMDQLHDRNTLELPSVLVRDELRDLSKPYEDSARKNKTPLDEARLHANLEPVARRRVALALILNKLIDAHDIQLDRERVKTAVEEIAASYEDPEQVVRWYQAEPSRLREIENMVMEDQMVDLVLSKAQGTEEHVPFQDLIDQAAGGAGAA